MRRSPTEHLTNGLWTGTKNCRISRTSRADTYVDSTPGYCRYDVANFFYRMASPRANIKCAKSWRVHLSQCKQMCLSDIADVYVISQASSIWRWIVTSENLENRTTPRGNLQQQRKNVGLWLVPLTMPRDRTRSIEVTECHHAPFICQGIPFENPLKRQFALPISVHRLFGGVFKYWTGGWVAVDCCRRREDKIANFRSTQTLEKGDSRSEILIEEASGIAHRLWD